MSKVTGTSRSAGICRFVDPLGRMRAILKLTCDDFDSITCRGVDPRLEQEFV